MHAQFCFRSYPSFSSDGVQQLQNFYQITDVGFKSCVDATTATEDTNARAGFCEHGLARIATTAATSLHEVRSEVHRPAARVHDQKQVAGLQRDILRCLG